MSSSIADIKDVYATLATLQRGALVSRYHGFSTVRGQNVGHHSHSVGVLLWLITGGTTGYHMMAALTHDLGEYVVGDIPSPTKRALTSDARRHINALENGVLMEAGLDFFELSDEEKQQLKLADIFDGMLFCITERTVGNKFITSAYNAYRDYAKQATDRTNPRHMLIYNALLNMWRTANDNR